MLISIHDQHGTSVRHISKSKTKFNHNKSA